MTGPLLTFAEARERLRMSERQLRKIVAEKRIACIKDGRWLRFEEDAIIEYIAAQRVPAAPRLRVVGPAPALPPDEQHLAELVAKHGLRR